MIELIINWFFQSKLRKYNGYSYDLYKKWFKECPLSFYTKIKILKNIKIITNYDIRNRLRKFYDKNKESVDSFDYIISLGDAGKSGDVILYEFRHSFNLPPNKFIRIDELISVQKKDAKVLFVDDLIGTGNQSVNYINNKLNLVLSPKMNFSILTLFATKSGLDRVSQETNVEIIHATTIIDESWDIFSELSKKFSNKEKLKIKDLNNLLAGRYEDFNKGLLLAFSYSVPNNTVRLIWKHDYKFMVNGVSKNWSAVLPRNY